MAQDSFDRRAETDAQQSMADLAFPAVEPDTDESASENEQPQNSSRMAKAVQIIHLSSKGELDLANMNLAPPVIRYHHLFLVSAMRGARAFEARAEWRVR